MHVTAMFPKEVLKLFAFLNSWAKTFAAYIILHRIFWNCFFQIGFEE